MKYPMFKVHVNSGEAVKSIEKVLTSGFLNEGVEVTRFRDHLESKFNYRRITLTNSGTSALTIAYRLAGVREGTEVITTPMTCVAGNTPIVNLGGKIVWADIDPENGNIDPHSVRKKITNKTVAISFVNWGGTPADLFALQQVAMEHKIPLIQDAAHSLGALWDNKPITEFADYTCFSFQAIKHLTTGDGGALCCRSEDDFKLANKLKWFGYDREALKDDKGEWKGQRWSADISASEVGYKANMNNLAAAIGLSQLPHIDGIISAHRKNAQTYEACFSDNPRIVLASVPPRAVSSYWVYTLRVVLSEAQRDDLLQRLNQLGIGAGLVHLPNDIYSAFENLRAELPGVERFAASQISLPCGWWLSTFDCENIAHHFTKIISGYPYLE